MTNAKEKEKDSTVTEDENPDRGNWSGQLDFLLSCLGYAVGLGNVWRFPYLCYKHGGGAFLIPYTLMLFFIGLPCFFMEISLGQYAAMGPVTLYSNLSPIFKGLGFANFMASCMVGLYYNMIIAWTIYYLFASFTSKLPWDGCQNDFNSDFCFSITDYKNCEDARNQSSESNEIIYHMGRCLTEEADLDIVRGNITNFYQCSRTSDKNENVTEMGIILENGTCIDAKLATEIDRLYDIPSSIRKTAAQEYLQNSVLKESSGIEDMGAIQWHLALSLLAAWIVIFLCLIKGIKSSGRVVYFTATFPYFVLVILFFRAVTLDGALEGIKFYIIPDLSRLSDIAVWEGAAVQIFFSLSVGGGGLTTLASYNKFHNNVLRDTIIVCFGNCLTSVFAGFAIFSVLGFLAKELGVDVQDVVQSGPGLAFIAYPDLVTRLPWAPFWAILFFAMLFTLGLDSQFAIVETIVTGIMDYKPQLRSKKMIIVGATCSIGFICGLPLTTEGGGYLLDLLDYYAAGWPYLFIGLTELLIISYVYGIQNFLDDLYHIFKFNPGQKIKSYFIFVYTLLSPLIIFIILLVSWARYEPLKRGDYTYPPWANGIGWLIAMIAILATPVVACTETILLFKKKGFSEAKRLFRSNLLHHTDEWRVNANRAKRRDNDHSSKENNALSMQGFDNVALENDAK